MTMLNKNIIIGLASFLATAAHAQYTIPDPAFAAALQQIVPNAMSGNVLYENSPDVTSLLTMWVSNTGLSDLDGIQFFTSLQELGCGNNLLTSLPALPNSVRFLNCVNNQIVSISALPDSLLFFDCSSNALTGLPDLPSSLQHLDCNFNDLASLPALPNSLTNLGCSSNQLTSLPTLPSSLTHLDCSSNELTVIPDLPNSLTHLFCSSNELTVIPDLPNSLIYVKCSSNALTNLPDLPNSLTFLTCSSNQLISLPDLPASLTFLTCSFNQLISLPDLPNLLVQLVCKGNQLTALPSLPNTLTNLLCAENSITVLPLLPSALQWLTCSDNSLSVLPELPGTLLGLECERNLLTCIPPLPDALYKLHCAENQITCLPNVPVALATSSEFTTANLGFAPVLCSTTDPCFPSESITGTIFNDANGNGLLDGGETAFLSGVAEAQPGNNLSAVDVNGSYGIPVQPGTYTVQGQAVLYHTITTPGHNVTVAAGMPATDNHIGYQTIPGIYDFVADISGTNHRPGFDSHMYLTVSNIGTEPATATISFDFDALQTWVSASIAPDVQIGNNAMWSIAMNPGDTWSANVTLNTPASVSLGSPVQHQLMATPDAPDTTPVDNMATWNTTVVGSYDPNDKQSSVSSLTSTEVQNGAWVDYTIRFQNTGTYVAENVLITDTLPQGLQANTFAYLASSHTNFWYIEDRVLHVRYDHIQLPDSNTNEPASQGFVKFRIMANTALLAGDAIENTANIYFDFNAPIITESSVVNVENSTRVNETGPGQELLLFPNPATGLVRVKWPSKAAVNSPWTLMALDGRVLLQGWSSMSEESIDIHTIPSGAYALRISSDDLSITRLLIKK